jgi:dTDP-4-amino-4,6-dideoxygalactose transaminase
MKISVKPQFSHQLSLKEWILSISYIFNKKISFNDVQSHFNNTNIFFTNFARTSLKVFLKSLNLPATTKVGVQAFTCHTVFNAILEAGYNIVFLDINESFCLDENYVREKISEVDILIVTHTFGFVAEVNKFKSMKPNLIILEDCSHALFTYNNGTQVGRSGDASFFSFGYGKYPSIGPGGFLCINNIKYLKPFEERYKLLPAPNIYEEILNVFKNLLWNLLYNKYIYGLFTLPFGKKIDNKFNLTKKYTSKDLKGFKSNVGLFNFKFRQYKLINTKIQTNNANYLIDVLNLNSIFTKIRKTDSLPNYFVFPLRSENRNKLIENFLKNGIEAGRYFSRSLIWAYSFGYKQHVCPFTEKTAEEIYTIPCYYSLKKKDLDLIIKIVKENQIKFPV